jgi:penicillin-insensitive murein endopeptidase
MSTSEIFVQICTHSNPASRLARPLALMAFLVLVGCASNPMNPWGGILTPAPGTPQAIGGYSAGCLQGAKSLYASGTGYRVMRISRRRYYGHPEMIQFIQDSWSTGRSEKVGCSSDRRYFTASRWSRPNRHSRHHQIGLDADIWFWQPGPEVTDLDSMKENQSPQIAFWTPNIKI